MTKSGSISDIDRVVEVISSSALFSKIYWKFSYCEGENLPFLALSVRIVKELISPGSAVAKFIGSHTELDDDAIGGLRGTGTHLSPQEFHAGVSNCNSVVCV